jgi:hypothetical protein
VRDPAGDAAGAAAVLDDRIGRAMVVAAYLLRQASELGEAEARLGL